MSQYIYPQDLGHIFGEDLHGKSTSIECCLKAISYPLLLFLCQIVCGPIVDLGQGALYGGKLGYE